MKYSEIKKEVAGIIRNQKKEIPVARLEELTDELLTLIIEGEGGTGELVNFVSEVEIYGVRKRKISIDSEPGKLKKAIRGLIYESQRPENVREIVEGLR